MTKQGYQLIATGQERYLHMAIDCALSIKYWDPERRIQLVTDSDSELLKKNAFIFDVITEYEHDSDFIGPMTKLNSLDYTVFEETMFVDADCLFLKDDIDLYWNRLAEYDVTVPGEKRADGEWYNMNISDMCRIGDTDYVLKMNSGSFFYKKNAKSKSVFDSAKHYYHSLGNFTHHVHRGIAPSDEPFLALAFGSHCIEPFPMFDDDRNALMISTVGTKNHTLSAFSGNPCFFKVGDIYPTIVHFVGLFPNEIYKQLCSDFRKHWATKNSAPL